MWNAVCYTGRLDDDFAHALEDLVAGFVSDGIACHRTAWGQKLLPPPSDAAPLVVGTAAEEEETAESAVPPAPAAE